MRRCQTLIYDMSLILYWPTAIFCTQLFTSSCSVYVIIFFTTEKNIWWHGEGGRDPSSECLRPQRPIRPCSQGDKEGTTLRFGLWSKSGWLTRSCLQSWWQFGCRPWTDSTTDSLCGQAVRDWLWRCPRASWDNRSNIYCRDRHTRRSCLTRSTHKSWPSSWQVMTQLDRKSWPSSTTSHDPARDKSWPSSTAAGSRASVVTHQQTSSSFRRSMSTYHVNFKRMARRYDQCPLATCLLRSDISL